MTKSFKENAEEFQDCNRYRNLINVYHDAVAAVDGCNGCAYTLKDDECIYAPPCSKSERLDGLPKIWVLSKDQSPKHYTNFESKESIMKQQVNVEDYNTLQAAIEKESHMDGDDDVSSLSSLRRPTSEDQLKIAEESLTRTRAELQQYKLRYENANKMQVAAQMKFAEFVRQGVLKMTPNGHEPVLTREHIDETVFMCKIRANRMAEALHKYKYQKNNAYANDKDREDAETEYMTALQLFNDTFSSL